jgi:hypothetical protein
MVTFAAKLPGHIMPADMTPGQSGPARSGCRRCRCRCSPTTSSRTWAGKPSQAAEAVAVGGIIGNIMRGQ